MLRNWGLREGGPNCGRGALGGMEWSVGLGCAGGRGGRWYLRLRFL